MSRSASQTSLRHPPSDQRGGEHFFPRTVFQAFHPVGRLSGGSNLRPTSVLLGESGASAYLHPCQGAGQSRRASVEESPGSTKQGWRVTPAAGNRRESAAESIPPMASSEDQARVKGCGKSAPGAWQQDPHGKPHPEQGRIGAARSRKGADAFRIDRPGWLLEP